MTKEMLRKGMPCRMKRLVTDHEGALYTDDTVVIVDWTETSNTNVQGNVVVFVVDDMGKHHSVTLADMEPA